MQDFVLLLRFHALGHDVDAELVRHDDDGLAQHGVVRAAREVADEAAVDLDVVDVEALEV